MHPYLLQLQLLHYPYPCEEPPMTPKPLTLEDDVREPKKRGKTWNGVDWNGVELSERNVNLAKSHQL